MICKVCVWELFAAADVHGASSSDVTIIVKKSVFSFQARNDCHVNKEQRKKKISVCEVDKVKCSCDLTMQTLEKCLRDISGTIIPVFRATNVHIFLQSVS